jgi:hypothetical protein
MELSRSKRFRGAGACGETDTAAAIGGRLRDDAEGLPAVPRSKLLVDFFCFFIDKSII